MADTQLRPKKKGTEGHVKSRCIAVESHVKRKCIAVACIKGQYSIEKYCTAC